LHIQDGCGEFWTVIGWVYSACDSSRVTRSSPLSTSDRAMCFHVADKVRCRLRLTLNPLIFGRSSRSPPAPR
jgi:hypothetical protein